jgi:hypothetical protein
MEAAHKLLLSDYATFLAAKKGVAKFIRNVVDETFYKDLEDPVTFFNSVTASLSTSASTVEVWSPKILLPSTRKCPPTTLNVRASPSISSCLRRPN